MLNLILQLIAVSIFLGLTLNTQTKASEPRNPGPFEDVVDLEEPFLRDFPSCSLETSKFVSIPEIASKPEKHIGECVRTKGYNSAALYDGLEAFVKTWGDNWLGIDPELLKGSRIGLFFHDNMASKGTLDRREIEVVGNIYSCEQWRKDAEQKFGDHFFSFSNYCEYAEGAILVATEAYEKPGQDHDPVLDLGEKIITEEGKIKNPNFGFDNSDCSWDASLKVDFYEISLNPSKYIGECVRISGISTGGIFFYSSLEGYYMSQRPGSANDYLFRIGGYFSDEQWKEMENWDRMKVEYLGSIGHCMKSSERFYRDLDRENEFNNLQAVEGEEVDQIIGWLSGFCHSYKGKYIFVDGYNVIGEGEPRIKGEEPRKLFGDLRFAEQEWEKRKQFEEALSLWWEEFFSSPGNFLPRDQRGFLYHTLNSFKEGNSGPRGSTYVLFEQLVDPEYSEYVDGVACFCLKENCKGEWPISSTDTFYTEGLPYFCLWIESSTKKVTVIPDWSIPEEK